MIRGAARGLFWCLALNLYGCSPSTESLWAKADDGGGKANGGAASSTGAGAATASAGLPSHAGGETAGAPVTSTQGGQTSSSAGAGGNATSGGGGTAQVGPHPRQKLEPEDGKTLLFIGQDTNEIESYSSALGMPAGVMLYSNVWDGLGVLSPSDFGGYGFSDLPHWRGESAPLAIQIGLDLDHGQNCGSCGGCTRAGFLEQLASGEPERVGVVRSIVTALRDSGHPVLMRVGYEFDAEICPGGFGKYPMQAYQQAFKRVHDIVQEEHADEIALVWAAWAFQARDPARAAGVPAWGWYPGDDVVDWIGVSVFPGYAPGDPTEQQQLDKRRQFADFAKNHGKPLMIAEASPRARFAPAQGEAAWNGWYAGVFDYISQNDVKAFCYINMNWEALGMWTGRGWGDSRVQGSAVGAEWSTATTNARFLKSSQSLYAEMGL